MCLGWGRVSGGGIVVDVLAGFNSGWYIVGIADYVVPLSLDAGMQLRKGVGGMDYCFVMNGSCDVHWD